MKHISTAVLIGFYLLVIISTTCFSAEAAQANRAEAQKFQVTEATITQIQDAIKAKQITATDLVNMYLERIKAYNGVCVNQPQGILGPVTPIQHAGQINALMTLNLRPAARKKWGFDDRKARSMTDAVDNDPNMPDALEVAAALDERFARTGQLAGPLHGVVFSIKDILDTYDMRTTSGADADYANDRPPKDATIIKRLRDAGAIILAKSNLGEYASGSRSSFGGTMCNPYDTERDVGGSSGGSASSVAANLVTCAISEEGGPSIRMPARLNNVVGLSQSQSLVSRDGIIGGGRLDDRNGATCRTVADVARVLDVIAGYDEADDFTVYSIGRIPKEGYASFANEKTLNGMKIGVVREYMDRRLFTAADRETIDIIGKAVDDLRRLGATIVDPGEGGALFQKCIDQYAPHNLNTLFTRQYPALFPPGTDHIRVLEDMYADPSLVPEKLTLRNLGAASGGAGAAGESKYYFNRYLRKRGDANIKDLTDLINKSRYYNDAFKDTRFRDVKGTLVNANKALVLDMREYKFNRVAVQQTIMQCMASLGLDAVAYPTGNIPAGIIKAPIEPDVNSRSHQAWTVLGTMGFPAMTVPAGFTTQVFDRVRDESGGTRLVGPVPAKLPVGIDFLAMPFGEPTLFRIASAYEAATHHRTPPAEFGSLEKSRN